VRDDTDNHRTLARIAARLLAVAELENEALAEIDRIASGIEREVRAKYIPVAVVAGFISSFVLVGLLVWIIAAFTGNNLGWRPVAAIVPMILLAAAPALYWRHFQYGLGPIRAKRPALYAGGSKATTDTLEKLFDYLGRRIAPRAYCRMPEGKKRYISHHVFMGRLRGLLLSEHAGDRAIVLPPYGLWFSGEIRIEADPEDIIAALKPKRRGGPGREPKYAYADAMIDMIDNPELSNIDLGDEIAARRKVEAMLVAWFQARADESGDAPRADMLRPYADKVIKRLWITRQKQADFSPEG
jgi:hypothetical protein